MLSYWETLLNISPLQIKGGKIMALDGIISCINTGNKAFELNHNLNTIRYISEKEYHDDVYEYVEPNFHESPHNMGGNKIPRFILFSAPGATGKSALAKHICLKKNGIYWDLPDSKVAQFSFEGAISNAVGYSGMSAFIESIITGENFFVIDAFDEAEAGSGRTGIEFFLKDLNRVTQDSLHTCAVLLARTETSLFIKNFFINNGIPFKHYEVGYFAEYNAKSYIRYGLEKNNIPITNIVNTCIDAQFKEIKRILNGSDADSFLGYAPVLNALSASYDDERNTLNLLKATENSDNSCLLLKKILDDLLTRERKKFLKALNIKVPELNSISQLVYDKDEQLLRIIGKILFDDSTLFVDVDASIPIEFREEYLEVVDIQLPQHPFIHLKESNLNTYYDFTGTAFRDFVIAYALSKQDISEYIEEYILDKKYCPSQLLIEFYSMFSNNHIIGKYISVMYNSFKAHIQLGDVVSVYINGDNKDCSVEFNLNRNDKKVLTIELEITDLENGIYLDQISNCYIDVSGKVYVGSVSKEARICNSMITCDEIIWRSENISVEAFSPCECVLSMDKTNYITNFMPHFEIKTDDRSNFKVMCKSLSGYYKLMAYKTDLAIDSSDNEFISFSNVIRRIFSCLRSHSKDTPARKMDFIDNRIININEFKKRILNFLLKEHILYSDEQDWLYKLDTSKLSDYAIKWHNVRDGKFDSLEMLYSKFRKSLKDTN